MTPEKFFRLLSEKPHVAEEFLQRPDCPIEFKILYLDDDDFSEEEDALD